MADAIPIVTFVGLSGTGKTTFLEKLIPELKREGLRLGVIKHDAHGFEVDKPGKDSFRFSAAGADSVAIVSGGKTALMETMPQEPSLDDMVRKMQNVDLILTEGYKQSRHPKIEIHRSVLHRPLLSTEEELLAVVTDEPLDTAAPQFSLEDAHGVALLLCNLLQTHRGQSEHTKGL